MLAILGPIGLAVLMSVDVKASCAVWYEMPRLAVAFAVQAPLLLAFGHTSARALIVAAVLMLVADALLAGVIAVPLARAGCDVLLAGSLVYLALALAVAATALPILKARAAVASTSAIALLRFKRGLERIPRWWRAVRIVAFLALQTAWVAVVAAAFAVPRVMDALTTIDNYADASSETSYQLIFAFGATNIAIVVGIALPIILVGRFVRRRLRRSADQAMARDPRPPILLLRSFVDDTSRVAPNALVARLQFRKRRLEEVIAAVIAWLGPFVAIGAPNESAPLLGAYRAYFDDHTWQQAVRDWIAKSRLVIMVAGLTEWIQWELRTLISENKVGNLIVVFPPTDPAATAARLELLQRCFADSPWQPGLSAFVPTRLLAVMLSDGGAVTGVAGRRRDQLEYELAILACLQARRP